MPEGGGEVLDDGSDAHQEPCLEGVHRDAFEEDGEEGEEGTKGTEETKIKHFGHCHLVLHEPYCSPKSLKTQHFTVNSDPPFCIFT